MTAAGRRRRCRHRRRWAGRGSFLPGGDGQDAGAEACTTAGLPRPLALGVREQGSPVLCSGRRARERASPWPVGSCAAPCAPARVRRQSVSMSVPLAPSRAPPGAARWLANAAAPTTTARDAAGDDAATHPPDVTRSRPCPSTSVATEHGHGSAPRTAVRDAGAPIGRLLIYLPQPLRSSAGRPAPSARIGITVGIAGRHRWAMAGRYCYY